MLLATYSMPISRYNTQMASLDRKIFEISQPANISTYLELLIDICHSTLQPEDLYQIYGHGREKCKENQRMKQDIKKAKSS